MIEKFKDFIRAFVEAYKNINSGRTLAKNLIDEYKHKVDTIEHAYVTMEEALMNIEFIYSYLPKQNRVDCVQKTIDLLYQGYVMKDDGKDGEIIVCDGVIGLYKGQLRKMSNNLEKLKQYYKCGDYDSVIKFSTHYNEEFDNFYKNNKIK